MNKQTITKFPGTGDVFYFTKFVAGKIVTSGWTDSREKANLIMSRF